MITKPTRRPIQRAAGLAQQEVREMNRHQAEIRMMIDENAQLKRDLEIACAEIDRLRREFDEFRNEAGHAQDVLADFQRRVRERAKVSK